MRSSRFLAALSVAVLLVAFTGCGGDDKKESSSNGSGAAPAKGADQAASTNSTTNSSGNSAAAGAEAIDVSCVLPEHFAAVVIKPKRIAALPLVAEQLKEPNLASAVKKFGIDPSEVEQLVLLFSVDNPANEKGPSMPEPATVMVVRFNHDVDAKEMLTNVQKAAGPGAREPIKEVQVSGKACFDLGPKDAPLAHAPNKSTIVLASKGHKNVNEYMEKILANTEPKGPLYEQLGKADADNEVIVVVSPPGVPNLDKTITSMGFDQYAKIIQGIQSAELTLNLKGETLIKQVIDAKDSAAAEAVEDMLKDTLRMARGGLAAARQSMPPPARQTFMPAFKLAEEALDGTKLTTTGNQVTATMARPADLEKVVGPLLEQAKTMTRGNAATAVRMNNLKQIALATLSYQDTFQKFPAAAIEKDGKRLLSWRVAILPFVEENDLYKQFHLDEPWDSAHNLEIAKRTPRIYQSADGPDDGKTRIMVFTGKGTAFDGSKAIKPADITDGLSNTILAVEAGPDKAVPWTKPEDLPFDPETPLAALGQISPEGFAAVFFDGSVRQLKVDNQTLKALITPNGGERVDASKQNGQ